MYQIIAPSYGLVELNTYDTSNHSGILLSGSTAFTTSSDFGDILIQEYLSDKFTIHYNEFSFSKKTKLSIHIESQLIQAEISLKTKFLPNIAGYKVMIKEGQFLIIPGVTDGIGLTFEQGKVYRQFSISFQHSFISDLIPYFPFLQMISNREQVNNSIIGKPRWMPKEMTDIINQVLNCPYEPKLRDFFLEEKMGDLLFFMLVETGKEQQALQYLSSSDTEKVYAARSIILNDITQHLNISQLARRVGLNQFKLKMGFKQIFGVGPFAFLKNERMNKAYELLLNTDKTIKDIHSIAGYSSLTSFVGAFRKFFGITPGNVRYRKLDK